MPVTETPTVRVLFHSFIHPPFIHPFIRPFIHPSVRLFDEEDAMGFVLGGMAGIVLARGGGSSSARRVLAGFGAGVGSGSAWTRTSMDIDDFLTTLTGKKE